MNPEDKSLHRVEDAEQLSAEALRRVIGDVSDAKIAAILRSEASLKDIEIASACAFAEDDSVSAGRHALAGEAAKVFSILTSDQADEEDQLSTERTAT